MTTEMAQHSSGFLKAAREFRGISRNLGNEIRHGWYWAAIAAIVLPTRIPPRRGIGNHRVNHRLVTVAFRSGDRLNIRIKDIYAVIEVFGLRSYDSLDTFKGPINQIVDVGANIGASVLWLGRHYPEARIMAIEPNPEAVTLLTANASRNGLMGRVQIWQVAVGGRKSTGRLVEGRSLADTRLTSTDDLGLPNGRGRVQVVALQDVLARLDCDIDLLKVDCEGGEFGLLGEATHADLARVWAVVGEYHASAARSWSTLERHLTEAGFSVRAETQAKNGVGTFVATRKRS